MMHHAEEPALMVLLLDILFHGFRERFVASLIALDDFTTSLGNDNNMGCLRKLPAWFVFRSTLACERGSRRAGK